MITELNLDLLLKLKLYKFNKQEQFYTFDRYLKIN